MAPRPELPLGIRPPFEAATAISPSAQDAVPAPYPLRPAPPRPPKPVIPPPQVPKVLGDRPDAWYTDAEYGRQALAGQNPCALAALTVLPEAMGSAIREEHVAGEDGWGWGVG